VFARLALLGRASYFVRLLSGRLRRMPVMPLEGFGRDDGPAIVV